MAAVKKDNPVSSNMIMYLVIGAGAFAAYWYVTHYGPNGASFDAAGNKIQPTYWDGWFGGATAQVASASSPVSSPSAPTQSSNTQAVIQSVLADSLFWSQMGIKLQAAPGVTADQVATGITNLKGLVMGASDSQAGSVSGLEATVSAMVDGIVSQAQTAQATPVAQVNPHQAITIPATPQGPVNTGNQPATTLPDTTTFGSHPIGQPVPITNSDPIGQRAELMGIVPVTANRAGTGGGMGMSFGGAWESQE